MKIDNAKFPKSSFLSMEKDTKIIIDNIFKNERLKRLLYYTSKDALDRPNLTEDQTLELFGKNIKFIPKLFVDDTVRNYILISFDKFNLTSNPEFRTNLIEFDILCHPDQWQLNDFALRPFKIAAELDSMFNNKRLTGIGTLEFVSAEEILMNNEYAGVCLLYRAVHGEEDKKFMPNPRDEERFLQDFKDFVSE